MSSENEQKPPAKPASTHPKQRAHRARRRARASLGSRWHSTEAAAEKLDIEPAALRQRVRRSSRDEGGQVVARLGMGVVARKFGTTWRFYFGEEEATREI